MKVTHGLKSQWALNTEEHYFLLLTRQIGSRYTAATARLRRLLAASGTELRLPIRGVRE